MRTAAAATCCNGAWSLSLPCQAGAAPRRDIPCTSRGCQRLVPLAATRAVASAAVGRQPLLPECRSISLAGQFGRLVLHFEKKSDVCHTQPRGLPGCCAVCKFKQWKTARSGVPCLSLVHKDKVGRHPTLTPHCFQAGNHAPRHSLMLCKTWNLKTANEKSLPHHSLRPTYLLMHSCCRLPASAVWRGLGQHRTENPLPGPQLPAKPHCSTHSPGQHTQSQHSALS